MARYHRILIDIEVEVVDPVALDAATLADEAGVLTSEGHVDLGPGLHDFPGFPGMPGSGEQMKLTAALLSSMDRSGALASAGLKFVSAAPIVRGLRDGKYDSTTVPAFPARNDDGTYDTPGE